MDDIYKCDLCNRILQSAGGLKNHRKACERKRALMLAESPIPTPKPTISTPTIPTPTDTTGKISSFIDTIMNPGAVTVEPVAPVEPIAQPPIDLTFGCFLAINSKIESKYKNMSGLVDSIKVKEDTYKGVMGRCLKKRGIGEIDPDLEFIGLFTQDLLFAHSAIKIKDKEIEDKKKDDDPSDDPDDDLDRILNKARRS